MVKQLPGNERQSQQRSCAGERSALVVVERLLAELAQELVQAWPVREELLCGLPRRFRRDDGSVGEVEVLCM